MNHTSCFNRLVAKCLLVAVLFAAALAGGCAGEPSRLVRVALHTADNMTVTCGNFEANELLTLVAAMGATKIDTASYTQLPLQPDTLLSVAIETTKQAATRPAGPPEGPMTFAYIYRGDECQPLAFGRSGPVGTLNGLPVFLDLNAPGAADWLKSRPAGPLDNIRSIRLGPDGLLNLDAMTRLKDSGAVVLQAPPARELSNPVPQQTLTDALVAMSPRGLSAQSIRQVKDFLPRLTHLTHLFVEELDTGDIRVLAPMKSLRFLGATFPRPASPATTQGTTLPATSTAPAAIAIDALADLQQLRSLRLDNCNDVGNYAPLGKLRGLRNLALSDCKQLTSLSPICSLTGLRSLVIGSDSLQSVSGIDKLRNLEFLVIMPLPKENKDLTPITRLKKLRYMVVRKDDLKEHAQELDKVRAAVPGVQIVGFCMGSAWILLIVPAGVIGGLVLRRLRRRTALQ